MKAEVILEDSANKEIINVDNISNKDDFYYIDCSNAKNHLMVLNDGIIINRIDIDHSTKVALTSNPFIEVSTLEGTLNFSTKVVEINKNFDIISIVYSVNDEVRKITIRYLGE